MADTGACLSLTESIFKSKSSSEGNKKKRLFEIRNSLITKSDRRTNVIFKNVIFRDEFVSTEVPKGELDKRSAQRDMMPARYLDIVISERRY